MIEFKKIEIVSFSNRVKLLRKISKKYFPAKKNKNKTNILNPF